MTPGPDTSPVHRSRLLLAALTISLAFAALAWRLYTIQVLEHERYLASAKAMRRSTETILAYRGDIHSRDGVLLSRDVVDYDLGMDPRLISSEKLAQVVRLVSDAAGKPAEYRRQRLLVAREAREASAGYVHLANGVSESLVAEIRGALSRILSKQEEKALLVNPQARRSYPRGPLAGCLVGVTDSSASGIEGVELTLGPYLSRRDGRRVVLKDAPRKTLIYSMESPDVLPVGGYDVYLTIDSRIQAIVEEELEAGIRRERAEAGVFIAMDPNSGDLLAMASYPSYDPNHFSEYPDPERKARRANRAVENAYEPGSVIKVFFASQILEKKICRLDQHVRELITGPVSWDGGKSARFGRRTVSDVHEHPNMTFQDAVVHSSNIGMSILGLQLGRDGILDTLERFGLCQRTGVELPFEVRGKHTSAKDWNPIYSSVSVTFGYEVMVSPIQLCRAFAALVNGGYLLKPRIVDRISLDGETQVFPSRQVVGQAVTAETSAQMREVLKLVVEQGTGKLLRIEGFEFGGKTGTADMSRGGYTKTDYLASFEGFAPFEAPELVALCMIEKPRSGSYYGGLVAGPVVVEVFRRVFHVAGETRLAALAKKAVRN